MKSPWIAAALNIIPFLWLGYTYVGRRKRRSEMLLIGLFVTSGQLGVTIIWAIAAGALCTEFCGPDNTTEGPSLVGLFFFFKGVCIIWLVPWGLYVLFGIWDGWRSASEYNIDKKLDEAAFPMR